MSKKNQSAAIRKNVSKKVNLGEKQRSVVDEQPSKAEVDEAFETVTGHKRPTRETTEETALLSETDQEKSASEGKMADLVLKHKATQKNGVHTYSADGYGWSIYVNKSAFEGAPDPELRVSGNFVKGSTRGGSKAVTPERAAKEEEKLAKAEARQKKADERIAKQREKVERLKKAQMQPA